MSPQRVDDHRPVAPHRRELEAFPAILGGGAEALLLSIVLSTFVLPALAARGRDGRLALRQALLAMFAAEVCYAVLLYVVYPRLV